MEIESIVALIAGFGGMLTSVGVLLKSRMEAHKTKAEASAIDTDADARRDTAVSQATETLVRNYELRLKAYEERLSGMEDQRETDWQAYDQAARADRAQYMGQVDSMRVEIASLKERLIMLGSLNRQLWRGVRILLTQLNGLEITPSWLPDPAWADALEEFDAQATPMPPTISRKWGTL